jgi:ABC-type antimicrobial peptide transport system permease subunit
MDPRAWKRFRKNKGAILGAALVLFVTGFAFLGPVLAPWDPSTQFTDKLIDQDSGLPKGRRRGVRAHSGW